MEGLALDAEAGALASSIGDLADRLENTGRLVRVDPSWSTTMYRGTMLSSRELDAVRQIKDVLRLGRVRRIEADRILLDRGEAAVRPEVVHIDCAALGLNNAPGTPIFQPDRIVLQQVRHLVETDHRCRQLKRLLEVGLHGQGESHVVSDDQKPAGEGHGAGLW